MAKNLLDLAKDMRRKNAAIAKSSSDYSARLAINIIYELVPNTPVDTSEALSNWQLSVGSPIQHDIPPYMPGMFGSTYNYSRDAAIRTAKRNVRGKKPGQVIYISNLAKHIVSLNEGSSSQAPAGFIEAGIIRARNKTKFEVKP